MKASEPAMIRQDIHNTIDEIARQLKVLKNQMDPNFDLDFSRDMEGIAALDGKLWITNLIEDKKVYAYHTNVTRDGTETRQTAGNSKHRPSPKNRLVLPSQRDTFILD